MHRRVEDGSGSGSGSGGGGESKKKKIEEAKTASHGCCTCYKMGNPIMEVGIKCPICQFIEKLKFPNTASYNDDNDNSNCDGEFSEGDLRGLFGDLRRLNLGHFPKEDDDDNNDNNDDNGISHHRNETDGCQLFIIVRGHDHKECIESQQRSGKNSFDLDSVLPGHDHGHGPDSVCTAEHQESKQAEADTNSPCSNPELAELPVPDLPTIDQTSSPPSPSPSIGDSTLSTPFAVNDGVENYWVPDYKLKDEKDI